MAPELRIWLDWKHTLISESERDEKLKQLAAVKLNNWQGKYREYGYLDTSAIVSCGRSVKVWLRSNEIKTFLMPMRPLMWYDIQGAVYIHTALRVKLEEWCQARWVQRLRSGAQMKHCGLYSRLLEDKENYMEWIREDDERQQQQQQEEAASETRSQSDSIGDMQMTACSLCMEGRKRKSVTLSPTPCTVRILHCSLCDKSDT